ncbi:MAG: L-lactate permease, partial [Candidatus Dormibacteraeota bacterium]|nr:L-lactate permease [Candidatus Dormibacteraeota bacterium]
MFTQTLDPLHSTLGDTLVALVPVAVLLILLGGLRLTAWLTVIIGAIVTIVLGILVWGMPLGTGLTAYGLGAVTGFWSINWIVFWGVIIYNTLVVTGAFDDLKRWLTAQGTADIRVQTILMAWAFGALMEGLVGFGFPWAVVTPILVGLGMAELAAVRVAALANNAPVSYGALGAPIIGLAAVTNLPLLDLSASVGKIVAILALAPPWLLIYLVAGRRGFRDGWPLAVVGSLAYIAGQLPTAVFLGPYLPDIFGSLLCFGALLLLLRVWRPRHILGFGGRELTPDEINRQTAVGAGPGAMTAGSGRAGLREAARGLIPFLILVVVVVLWTGPWSTLTKFAPFKTEVLAHGSLGGIVKADWSWTPFVAGTAILVSWLLILAYLRPRRADLPEIFRRTFKQMWGALLVGPLIYGLAFVFNFSGMASSMAFGFSRVGTAFIVLAPILGWIGVALSGSNTSTNAVFGAFQLT